MESPFVFGKIAKGKSFINRKNELKQLTDNFSSGINTMIVSPRRWGKSSLVLKAAEQVSRNNKKIKICYIDLYRIHDEQHFFESFAHEVLKASSNKMSLSRRKGHAAGQLCKASSWQQHDQTGDKK